MFHISQLKKAVGTNHQVSAALPDHTIPFQVPMEILDRRFHQHHHKTIPQVFIRWSHLPTDLATWEDEEALCQDFPRAPAWGQAVSRRGGHVTDASNTVGRTRLLNAFILFVHTM